MYFALVHVRLRLVLALC